MQRHGLILGAIVGGMLFVFLGSAFGQTAAVVVGSVKDPSGAVLPGATVVARHLETNEERQDVTNAVGDFRISLVNIGDYAIRAQLSGFKTAVMPKVMIQLGQTARIDMTLEIGEVTDTVTVSDVGPLVRSETVSLGEVMDNRKILELPL